MSQKRKAPTSLPVDDDYRPCVYPGACHPLLYTRKGVGSRHVDFYTLSKWYPFLRRYCYYGSKHTYVKKRLLPENPCNEARSLMAAEDYRCESASEVGGDDSLEEVETASSDGSRELTSVAKRHRASDNQISNTTGSSWTGGDGEAYSDSYNVRTHSVPPPPPRKDDTTCFLDWLDPRCSLALCKAQFAHDMGVNISMPLHHLCPPLARTQGYLFWVAALTESVLEDLSALRRSFLSSPRPATTHTTPTSLAATVSQRSAGSTPAPAPIGPQLPTGTGARASTLAVAAQSPSADPALSPREPLQSPQHTTVTRASRPVRFLDIGTGASAVFPLYLARMHGWVGVATDVDPESVWWARKNIRENSEPCNAPLDLAPGVFEEYPHLSSRLPLPSFNPAVAVLRSASPQHFLDGVLHTYPRADGAPGTPIGADEAQVHRLHAEAIRPAASSPMPTGATHPSSLKSAGATQTLTETAMLPGGLVEDTVDADCIPTQFEVLTCNPPFFSSEEEARQNPHRECSATSSELACEGGEEAFVSNLIVQTAASPTFVRVCTTMLGKKASLDPLVALLRSQEVAALALASLPDAYSPVAEYVLADPATRVALAFHARKQRAAPMALSREPHAQNSANYVSDASCAITDHEAYSAHLLDVLCSGAFSFPLVLQHSYTQGRQTRWALAWSFDVEVCVAAAKYRLNKFRQQMRE